MRYSVAIPQANHFSTPQALEAMAHAVEDLGYDGLWIADHIVVPVGEGYVPELMHEPLALLPWLAARTRHVRLGISVLVLPYRDATFTAKYLASLDALCDGRLELGVGAGWLEREFEALSVPFAERGPRTDEALRVLRNLWEHDTCSFEGRFKRYTDMRMFPKAGPSRRGRTIPITVGGNSTAAIRRAAELGDGWHPMALTPAKLAEKLPAYLAQCERFERSPGPVNVRVQAGGLKLADGRRLLTGSAEQQAQDVRDFAAAGADELMLTATGRTVHDLIDAIRAFMRNVVPRV
ncbi:MAG: TIGR03619 family F420-dependent LLM class oxidoreductase [Acidimicrobiales bacterium]|nr:TIGR03619 family F420-dependent LLM class oxidoreductase [Acidimicrobiales bacterium]